MKASLTAKIIVIICFLCLAAGIFAIDKHKPYINEKGGAKNAKIMSNTSKVAVIELNGAIASSSESDFFGRTANADNMLKSLKTAKDDKEIQGIILKINSPGGTVAMSQNIYNQIMLIRKEKPIISVLDDVAASGGYYIACASDRIIAQEGTLTGSIGVIFSFMDYHNLLANKLDISPVVIKSGRFKDIGSGTRQMTAEEKELMQNIVDDSYEQFLNAIKLGRIERNDSYSASRTYLTEDILKKYADGRVFTGRQAKRLGFVDETGDLDSAKSIIETIIQEKNHNKLKVKLIDYNRRGSLSDYFSALTEYGFQGGLKLSDILPLSMILNRKPLYLWE